MTYGAGSIIFTINSAIYEPWLHANHGIVLGSGILLHVAIIFKGNCGYCLSGNWDNKIVVVLSSSQRK